MQLKVRQSQNDFFQSDITSKKRIKLYSYETSGQLVFIHFLEEIEDTKKTF